VAKDIVVANQVVANAAEASPDSKQEVDSNQKADSKQAEASAVAVKRRVPNAGNQAEASVEPEDDNVYVRSI
jgi:hypothetical protein